MSFNDFNATKSTRSVLGGVYDVKIISTFFLYNGKRRAGMLNCGKTKHIPTNEDELNKLLNASAIVLD